MHNTRKDFLKQKKKEKERKNLCTFGDIGGGGGGGGGSKQTYKDRQSNIKKSNANNNTRAKSVRGCVRGCFCERVCVSVSVCVY